MNDEIFILATTNKKRRKIHEQKVLPGSKNDNLIFHTPPFA